MRAKLRSNGRNRLGCAAMASVMLFTGCTLSETREHDSRPRVAEIDMKRLVYGISNIDIVGRSGTIESMRFDCGYSGDVVASEPGAEVYWSDLTGEALGKSVDLIVSYLAKNGFLPIPGGDLVDDREEPYRGTVMGSFQTQVEGDVMMKVTVSWLDPTRIGKFERAAFEWMEPNRLIVGVGLEPNGC